MTAQWWQLAQIFIQDDKQIGASTFPSVSAMTGEILTQPPPGVSSSPLKKSVPFPPLSFSLEYC
jgi:hypothetical protein